MNVIDHGHIKNYRIEPDRGSATMGGHESLAGSFSSLQSSVFLSRVERNKSNTQPAH